MPEQFGEKTQEATPFRRQKAREQGQVPKSQDLTSACLLMGAVLIVMFLGTSVVNFLCQLARHQLGEPAVLQADVPWAVHECYRVGSGLAWVLLPMFGLIFLVAIAVNVGQTGLLFLPQKLAFDLQRVNPAGGLKRLFTTANLIRLAFGVFNVCVVALVAGWSLWDARDKILGLSGLPVSEIAATIAELTIWTCLKIGAALAVLAVLDYLYQRYRHEQDLRMTPQEVREEMKSLQGDPQVIARRRAVQRQLVLQRLGTAVPQADVVLTNSLELAVAIRFDPQTMDAPVVVAKGAGHVAQRVRRLALENAIPIVQRKRLSQKLYREVELNQPIPAAHYAATAAVLKYVDEMKGEPPPPVRQAA